MSSQIVPEPAGYNPNANQAPYIISVLSVMIGLSLIAVCLRFLSRRISKCPLMWDDWLILIALVRQMSKRLATSSLVYLRMTQPFSWLSSMRMINGKLLIRNGTTHLQGTCWCLHDRFNQIQLWETHTARESARPNHDKHGFICLDYFISDMRGAYQVLDTIILLAHLPRLPLQDAPIDYWYHGYTVGFGYESYSGILMQPYPWLLGHRDTSQVHQDVTFLSDKRCTRRVNGHCHSCSSLVTHLEVAYHHTAEDCAYRRIYLRRLVCSDVLVRSDLMLIKSSVVVVSALRLAVMAENQHTTDFTCKSQSRSRSGLH